MSTARCWTFDELTAYLKELARVRPELVRLSMAGKGHEGCEIWAVKVAAPGRPTYNIDWNHHAGQVTGCAVCIYPIGYLGENHGTDPLITEFTDSRVFYIIPRVSPDGAEKYLTTPYHLRSNVRRWPLDGEPEGLIPEDVDGNGSILQMRVPDPDGNGRASYHDPRGKVRRRPDEQGGTYHHLFPEGRLTGDDPAHMALARPRWDWTSTATTPAHGGENTGSRAPGRFRSPSPKPGRWASFPSLTATSPGLCHTKPRAESSCGRGVRPRIPTSPVTTWKPCVAWVGAGRSLPGIRWFRSLRASPRTKGACRWAASSILSTKIKVSWFDPGAFQGRGWGWHAKTLRWVTANRAAPGFTPRRRLTTPGLGPVETGGLEPKFLR